MGRLAGNQIHSFENSTIIHSFLFYRFLFQNFLKKYVTEIENTPLLTPHIRSLYQESFGML